MHKGEGRNNEKGTEYEVDPRHVQSMLSQVELEIAKSAVTPGRKEACRTKEHDNQPLNSANG